jgi:hypothetical protein
MQCPGCDAVMTNMFPRQYLAEQKSEARGSGVTEIARFSHGALGQFTRRERLSHNLGGAQGPIFAWCQR